MLVFPDLNIWDMKFIWEKQIFQRVEKRLKLEMMLCMRKRLLYPAETKMCTEPMCMGFLIRVVLLQQ